MKDINMLKYGYSTQEILKLKEYVEMMTAMETAAYKDQEREAESQRN